MTLATRSVIDAVRDEIQGLILSGTIAAGTLVTELSVAHQLDVARPTAKAAIEQLVHTGLLRRPRNKTARVPLLGAHDVRDLYMARALVETAVVRLLADQREAPNTAIAAQRAFTAAIRDGSPIPHVVAADIAFHRALTAASDSPRLTRLHEAVIGEAHLGMAQVQRQGLLPSTVIAGEHQRVLDAIAAGDADLAAREMSDHLDRACSALVTHIERQNDQPSDPVQSPHGSPRG